MAVRSSGMNEDGADASYAGLFTTVLDVHGEAALIDAVRALAFGIRRPGDLVRRRQPPRLAVLVQPMVACHRGRGRVHGRPGDWRTWLCRD